MPATTTTTTNVSSDVDAQKTRRKKKDGDGEEDAMGGDIESAFSSREAGVGEGGEEDNDGDDDADVEEGQSRSGDGVGLLLEAGKNAIGTAVAELGGGACNLVAKRLLADGDGGGGGDNDGDDDANGGGNEKGEDLGEGEDEDEDKGRKSELTEQNLRAMQWREHTHAHQRECHERAVRVAAEERSETYLASNRTSFDRVDGEGTSLLRRGGNGGGGDDDDADDKHGEGVKGMMGRLMYGSMGTMSKLSGINPSVHDGRDEEEGEARVFIGGKKVSGLESGGRNGGGEGDGDKKGSGSSAGKYGSGSGGEGEGEGEGGDSGEHGRGGAGYFSRKPPTGKMSGLDEGGCKKEAKGGGGLLRATMCRPKQLGANSRKVSWGVEATAAAAPSSSSLSLSLSSSSPGPYPTKRMNREGTPEEMTDEKVVAEEKGGIGGSDDKQDDGAKKTWEGGVEGAKGDGGTAIPAHATRPRPRLDSAGIGGGDPGRRRPPSFLSLVKGLASSMRTLVRSASDATDDDGDDDGNDDRDAGGNGGDPSSKKEDGGGSGGGGGGTGTNFKKSVSSSSLSSSLPPVKLARSSKGASLWSTLHKRMDSVVLKGGKETSDFDFTKIDLDEDDVAELRAAGVPCANGRMLAVPVNAESLVVDRNDGTRAKKEKILSSILRKARKKKVLDEAKQMRKSFDVTVKECVVAIGAYMLLSILAFSFVFERWPVIDSLYFSVVTFTTIGYGDLTPTTTPGQFFMCFFGLGGVASLGLALGVIGSDLIEAQVNSMSSAKQSAQEKSQKEVLHLFVEEDDDETESGGKGGDENASSSRGSPTKWKNWKRRGGSCIGYMARPLKTLCSILSSMTARIILPLLVVLLGGSAFIAATEGWSVVTMVYYMVVTTCTIGFGDYSPTKPETRLFSVVFIPVAVAVTGQILGAFSTFVIEKRQNDFNAAMSKVDLQVSHLEGMSGKGDGIVTRLDYVEFMLLVMNKVDRDLLDELHRQFDTLDETGDGSLTENDLKARARKKLRSARKKLELAEYKESLMKKAGEGSQKRRKSSNLEKVLETLVSTRTDDDDEEKDRMSMRSDEGLTHKG